MSDQTICSTTRCYLLQVCLINHSTNALLLSHQHLYTVTVNVAMVFHPYSVRRDVMLPQQTGLVRGNKFRENADVLRWRVTKCGCLAGNGHVLDAQTCQGNIFITVSVCIVAPISVLPWWDNPAIWMRVNAGCNTANMLPHCGHVRPNRRSERWLVRMQPCPQILNLSDDRNLRVGNCGAEIKNKSTIEEKAKRDKAVCGSFGLIRFHTDKPRYLIKSLLDQVTDSFSYKTSVERRLFKKAHKGM